MKYLKLSNPLLINLGFVANKYNDEFTLTNGKYTILLDCEYTDRGIYNLSINNIKLPVELKYIFQLMGAINMLTEQKL